MAIAATADNGSGAIRVTGDNTFSMVTGDVLVVAGTGTIADSVWTITVIDANCNGTCRVDLQGSSFSGAPATGGVLGGGTKIPTMAALLSFINQYNVNQRALGAFPGANTIVAGGGTGVTLTNPVSSVQIVTGTAGGPFKVVLPQANLFGSLPIGTPLILFNQLSNGSPTVTAGFFANDGTTLLATAQPHQAGTLWVKDIASTNGGWTPGGAQLDAIGATAAWYAFQGGTGLISPAAHGMLIAEGAAPFNVVTPATAGRYWRDNGGGVDPGYAQVQFSELGGAAAMAQLPSDAKLTNISFFIDGGGSAITTGMKGYLRADFPGTINQVTLLGDQSCSIVVDVWKTTKANFDAGATHPVAGDSITASDTPTLSSATVMEDSTLTGWTTSFSAGDIFAFNVNSVTACQRVTLVLKATKS